MKTNKNGTVVKVNPKWRLDEETIALVKEARVALGLQGACDVVALWAKQWKLGNGNVEQPISLDDSAISLLDVPMEEPVKPVKAVWVNPPVVPVQNVTVPKKTDSLNKAVIDVWVNPPVVAVDVPRAERVETPYQIERRRKLEELRAKLEGTGLEEFRAAESMEKKMAGEPLVLPFDVLVNGERHRVIEFKGRRVLEWVGPSSTVMKKNLSPQEVVIYWGQRVAKP